MWSTWLLSSQAAEQAKASPALVAKDPSTSTNKKEEEDLAKGKEDYQIIRALDHFFYFVFVKDSCIKTLFNIQTHIEMH